MTPGLVCLCQCHTRGENAEEEREGEKRVERSGQRGESLGRRATAANTKHKATSLVQASGEAKRFRQSNANELSDAQLTRESLAIGMAAAAVRGERHRYVRAWGV